MTEVQQQQQQPPLLQQQQQQRIIQQNVGSSSIPKPTFEQINKMLDENSNLIISIADMQSKGRINDTLE
jgi:hypothetical protein